MKLSRHALLTAIALAILMTVALLSNVASASAASEFATRALGIIETFKAKGAVNVINQRTPMLTSVEPEAVRLILPKGIRSAISLPLIGGDTPSEIYLMVGNNPQNRVYMVKKTRLGVEYSRLRQEAKNQDVVFSEATPQRVLQSSGLQIGQLRAGDNRLISRILGNLGYADDAVQISKLEYFIAKSQTDKSAYRISVRSLMFKDLEALDAKVLEEITGAFTYRP